MTLNWLAIIIAAVVKFAIGAGWYAPPVFGAQWQALTKQTPEQVQAGLPQALVAEAVTDVIMAYVLARFILHYTAVTFIDGAFIGIMAWLGFVATVLCVSIFYEKRPLRLVAINAGYLLVSLAVMGGIIGWWH